MARAGIDAVGRGNDAPERRAFRPQPENVLESAVCSPDRIVASANFDSIQSLAKKLNDAGHLPRSGNSVECHSSQRPDRASHFHFTRSIFGSSQSKCRRRRTTQHRVHVIPNWADDEEISPLSPADNQWRHRWEKDAAFAVHFDSFRIKIEVC
jgi:hypothetical protein